MQINIRPIGRADARQYLDLLLALDQETDTMMLEPGERRQRPEEMQAHIERTVAGGSLLLAAEAEGALIGYLSAERGPYRRCRHTAYITVGIKQAYRGQGVGTALLSELDMWAAEHGVSRLELTAMTHNEAAVSLYQKQGFIIEGTRARSMLVRGRYVDEYYMAKIQ